MESNHACPEVYVVKHKSEAVRSASRSGGIFTAISDLTLEDGGIVYGAVLTDDFRAAHIRAYNAELRNQMRGSKYIQSELGNTYKNVKTDLDGGKKVLFSGTSCQVAGLCYFLGKEYESLTCVDIVCHGVPSKNVWLKYLEWQEQRANKKVVAVDFRNKKDFGWRAHTETLIMDDGSTVSSEVFKTLFYGHTVLRPCCYECPYKDVIHPGDITIADYWGIEKAAPEFDDNKGVSLVLINSDKARATFEECKNHIKYKETRLEDSMQPPLKAPFPRPANRDIFWSDLQTLDFEVIAKRYGGYGNWNVVKRKVKGFNKRIRKLVKG